METLKNGMVWSDDEKFRGDWVVGLDAFIGKLSQYGRRINQLPIARWSFSLETKKAEFYGWSYQDTYRIGDAVVIANYVGNDDANPREGGYSGMPAKGAHSLEIHGTPTPEFKASLEELMKTRMHHSFLD